MLNVNNKLDNIMVIGHEIVHNVNYTKAEVASLKILINDLNKIKGSLDSTTMLLQNTLIPNLEELVINKLNEMETDIENTITVSETNVLAEIKLIKVQLNTIINKLNN